MRPPLTTANQDDHAAAAAYLMKHAGASALMVLPVYTGHPIGIITEKDIAHSVADGKDLEQTRIHDLMTAPPDRHQPDGQHPGRSHAHEPRPLPPLPVSGDTGLIGMLDITDVCRALIDPDLSQRPTTGNARSL